MECLAYRNIGNSKNEGATGYCDLVKQTKCSGNVGFCKHPEALKKYLSGRGLGWKEGNRRAQGPEIAIARKFSTDLVSQSIIEHASSLPKPFLIVIAFVIVILVGVLTRLTGPELSSSILYLIPISLVTWFTKRWVGIAMSIVSTLTWFIADATSGVIFSHSSLPYWNGVARFGSFFVFTCILAALRRVLEDEKESSRIDSLTRVANRKQFIELADMEIKRAQIDRIPFTVVYIDLDNFKWVNDRFGHSAGDNLLRLVARTIKGNVRETDTVARLGGDEFAILLPGIGAELAEIITGRIQKTNLEVMHKHDWPVTFSMGAATFASPPSTVDEVLKASDELMYGVKKEGKNNIRHEVFGKEERPSVETLRNESNSFLPPFLDRRATDIDHVNSEKRQRGWIRS